MTSESVSSLDDLPSGTAEELLREMLRIRIFEEAVLDVFQEGDIPGFLHLCHGHEGSHAGMGVAMAESDWLAVGGSRMHGQYIVKGVPMTEIMAELYGKATGPNKGKGGSMHLADIDRRLYGHAATIGSGQNPAVGMALAEKMKGTDDVVLSTIGDGGTNRGSFHTALVFASVWDLPIVFIIENNDLAISYSTQANQRIERLADYGDPLKIPSTTIDGRDPVEVYGTVSAAIERAREGDGPTLIESKVRRMRGHFEGDKETYRSESEKEEAVEEWDPVELYRERVLESGVLDEADVESLSDDIEADAEAAIEFARESPMPDAEVAYEDVYVRPLYGEE